MSVFFKKISQISLVLITITVFHGNSAFAQTTSGVDIVIEPTSYIPQFYKGKPVFINQGTARLVAVPNIIASGKILSSKNLNFKWTRNGIVLSSDSGLGKNSLTINGSVPIRDISVDVEITDSSGNVVAEASRTISASSPKVLLYENSPIYGVLLNRALSASYSLGGREELNIVAKPYFFNIDGQAGSDVEYKWSVNGNSVTLSGKKNELLLKQSGTGAQSSAIVSVDVNNTERIFQFTNSSFNLNFGQ